MKDKSLKDKAISIKGKKYVLVSDRVLYFNENYPSGAIETEYTLDNDTYHFKATVTPDIEKPTRRFVGHSQAVIGDGMVNKTASMENAETSAVGRALAMMGIGVLDSIASADEMNKATNSSANRYATPKQIAWMRSTASRVYGLDHQDDIDKAIESLLTIPIDKVPLSKVKAAVDKIEADKPKSEPLTRDKVVEVTDEDIAALERDELPY